MYVIIQRDEDGVWYLQAANGEAQFWTQRRDADTRYFLTAGYAIKIARQLRDAQMQRDPFLYGGGTISQPMVRELTRKDKQS